MSAMTAAETTATFTTDRLVPEGDARRCLSLPLTSLAPSSPSPVAPLPLSPSLVAIKTSAMFSAAKRLVQVKENLSEFQKKGGFVGWLHGDESEQRQPSDVEQSDEAGVVTDEAREERDEEDAGDSFALAYSPTSPKREVLDSLALAASSLWTASKPNATPEDSPSPSSPVPEPALADGAVGIAGAGEDEVEDDGLHTPPSPRSASTSPDKAVVAPSAPTASEATSMIRRQRYGSSSMFESLYEKVTKASSSGTSSRTSSSPRISLQPSPRRTSKGADALASDFDDFISAENTARRSKFFRDRVTRQRAASDSPWGSPTRRAPSPATPPLSRVGRAHSVPFNAQQQQNEEEDAAILTLDDYLADPKLAAEFVSASLPHDGALLMLLYAIEEFDALATLPTASEQAEVSARTLLDNLRALRDRFDGTQQPPNASSMGCVGSRTLATLSQVALPTTEDVEAIVRTAQLAGGGLTLAPAATKLFRSVHSAVYAELDAAFTQQFTRSSAYARLMADRQRELQAARQLDSALLLVDALLEDEWASTVLWVFLFRVSRHERLSFLMDVRFRLEPRFAEYMSTTTIDGRQHRQLVTQFDALTAKFLRGSSPVPLPSASIDVARLKAATITRVARLTASSTVSESEEAARVRLTSTMEGVRSLASAVRAEFAATEKLAAFSASALFREFVTSPSAPRGDVVRLFRSARISFHQAPKRTACPSDLLAEYIAKRQLGGLEGGGSDDHCDNSLIYRMFAFERRNVETESGRTTFVDLRKCCRCEGRADEDGHGDDAMLLRTIESFLTPELAPSASLLDEQSAQRRLAFHFVAGAGDDALYGSVIRVPMHLPVDSCDGDDINGEGKTEVATQGVCVLSRAPLVDSLRRYIHALWRRLNVSTAPTEALAPSSDRITDVDVDRVCEALTGAQAAFDGFVDEHHAPSLAMQPIRAHGTVNNEREEECAPPTMDVQLRGLFESLSVANVVRVFGCLVSEKKLVLVSSSYSLLVTAGEALRALLFPLTWAHVFAPVLPLSLRAYLQCPSPFLFGLHASYFRVCELPNDVVIVDLDRDVVSCSEDTGTDAALSGLRDILLALCRPRVFTRDDIDYESVDSAHHRPFPEREVRLAFRQQLESMLSVLEAAAFRFESSGGDATTNGSDAANSVVAAVVDAPEGEKRGTERCESPEARLLAALRQSQAFSAHLCRPLKV